MEEEQRERLFKNLLNALWPPPSNEQESTQGTFAAYDDVKYSEGFILKSFRVEGAGELQLPLSAEDAARLRSVCDQVPFGNGLDTLADINMRRYWQMDASKVSFPEMPTFLSDTLQRLAMKAVRALGVIDGREVQLEAHPYKLLLCDAGGQFTFHRDTEKEKGIFATLILQLPTEEGYTGGELVVNYHNQVKQFDCHLVSALGYCYCTVFFADWMQELRKIASGTKLFLAFNLIKQDSSLNTAQRVLISSRMHKAEAALEPWLQETTDGKLNVFSGKLAIPLKHKYTETNLSFAQLKGDDRIVVEILKDCRDMKKEKWLHLHLCLVTKHQTGIAIYNDFSSDSDPENADHHSMWDVLEEQTEFKNWIDLDDNPVVAAFENLHIDLKKEVVLGEEGGPFDSEPDEKRYEGYQEWCDGPTLEYWYHRAMLVVWPKAMSASIACEAGVSGALELLKNMLKSNDPEFLGQLRQVVRYCGKHPGTVWKSWSVYCTVDPVTPGLLSLCTRVRDLEDVLYILRLLAKASWSYGVESEEQIFTVVGVRNVKAANAIATVVQVFGWEVVSADIINLVKECALTHGEYLAKLAKQLVCMGNKDVGALVVHTMSNILEARIAELESHKNPDLLQPWCQPLAKLPDYPDIESFLKGPQEKYVYRGAQSLRAAKSIVERFFSTSREDVIYRYNDSDGYSATGTLDEQGQFIVIQKTRRMQKLALWIWDEECKEKKRLSFELRKARLAIPQTDIVALTTCSDCSCQGGSKRQRVGTKV